MVYEVSCFRNPQKVYGLADGTTIAFVNVSIKLQQAQEVVFHGIKTKLLNSPYFNEKFPYNKNLKTALHFPNNILIQPTTNPIGYNVFGGVLDEVNFMALVESSKVARGGKYDQAQSLHDNLIRRMKSRFMRKGKLPGILLSISSSRYPDDFTERMIEQAKTNPRIFVRRYSQWGTKPKSFYIGEYFKVSLGDGGTHAPKIVENEEELKELEKEGVKIIDVPIEYRKDFEVDIDGAIRDLAGYPTLTIKPFIIQRHKIFDAVERGKELGLEHSFSMVETTLQDGGKFIAGKLRKHSYPCFCHIDLGLTGDSAGFCMGHVEGYKTVARRNDNGDVFTEVVPNIVIDVMLRVNPPKGGEINLASVRSLVFELRSYGFKIQKVTYDQYQCFTGDTKISLLDGRELSFIELLEEQKRGKEIWVYAYDIQNNKIVPAKAINIRKTGTNAQLVKVTLDNGEVIRCTPNHKFLLRNGTYKEAWLLEEGDALMPLYRRYWVNYEWVYQPHDKKYETVKNKLKYAGIGIHDFKKQYMNHKVVSVEFCGKEDVYDLEVPKYHNFALSSGIFVHNSAESIQQLKSRGIDAERLSIDASLEPYNALKYALYEDRLTMYEYEPVITELIKLEKNEEKGKVDHPAGGSKDVADALAGVCYLCSIEKPKSNIMPSYGQTDIGILTTNSPTFTSKTKGEGVERKKPKKDILDRYLDDIDDYY